MAMSDRATAATGSGEQIVVFTIGGEYFGIGIERVNTIIRMPDITRIPNMPSHVLGITNLRGTVIPVIDLRSRFGIGAQDDTKATRVIVAETGGLMVGVVVDSVTQTMHLPGSSIEPFNTVIGTLRQEYLRGVGKDGDRLIILLDLDRVLSTDETDELRTVADSHTDADGA